MSESFEIDKEYLLNKFVAKLHDSFGQEWQYFETFYSDSEREAFGTFWNSADLLRYPRITPQSLKSRRQSISKSKWRNVKEKAVEKVYILYFKEAPFLKVGHTYQDFERRMYGYLFPGTDSAPAIAEYEIDFKESLLITTYTCKPKNTRSRKIKVLTLERKLLTAFKAFKFKSIPGRIEPREFLDVRCISEVKGYLLSGKHSEISQVQTLAEYTGFANSTEMRLYNLQKGVTDKAVMFWKRKDFIRVLISGGSEEETK